MVEHQSEYPSFHPMAKLYGHWVFNFLVELSRSLAEDLIERPQHHRRVPNALNDVVTGFRSSMGSHPDWPDTQQRISIFRALGSVCIGGAALREAALVFVEDGRAHNHDLLVDAFWDAAMSFRNQVKSEEGQALDIGCRQIDRVFGCAVKLMRCEEITRVFDMAPAPAVDGWPIVGHREGHGANLATELIRAISGVNHTRGLLGGPMRESVGPPKPGPIEISMSQNKFILLQQAAWYGGLVISETLASENRPEDLQPLIGNVYKWTKALQRLTPDVVRVWKDPNYRMRLTDLEWGMVEPHPSGSIDLSVAGVAGGTLGAATHTVRTEVCCCTGDLPCPASSNCEISPNPSCLNCGTFAVINCG